MKKKEWEDLKRRVERKKRIICPYCGAVDSMRKKVSNPKVLYPIPPPLRPRYVCSKCGYEFSSFDRSTNLDFYEVKNNDWSNIKGSE